MRRCSLPTTVLTVLVALALLFAVAPGAARAQMAVGISVNFGPPPIPVYEQPPCPTPNDLWSPGYWAYADGGYYWVPGTWVPAPDPGLLWTPGYWAWNNGFFFWNAGYWAPQVGFYGGVNYGFGYFGNGYAGGRWQGNQFRYNTAVSNVNRNAIRNVYSSRTGIVNNTSRVSYNGGRGGIAARPTQSQSAVASGHRVAPTSVQTQHERVAAQSRANRGRPATAAVARPLGSSSRPAAAPHAQRQAAPQQQRQAAPQAQRQAAPHAQRQAAPHVQRQAAPQQQRQAAPQAQRQAAPQQQRQAAPQQQHQGPHG
jgi:hypothetical protein